MATGDAFWRRASSGPTRTCSSRRTASRSVLVDDMGLVPGNRVLLRGAEQSDAGGLLVRRHEGRRHRRGDDAAAARQGAHRRSSRKAEITHALCDARLADELELARGACPSLRDVRCFNDASATGLEATMAAKPAAFRNVDTAADDTVHHRVHLRHHRQAEGHDAFPPRRDGGLRVLAASRAAREPRRRLHRQPAARVHVRPRRAAAVSRCASARRRVLLEKAAPRRSCSTAIEQFDATVLFTAPTSYRAMARTIVKPHAIASLRKCVSAGEALPAATRKLWKDATGIELIDGIGATEMLHIFISADEARCASGRDRQGGARLSRLRDGRRRAGRCRPAASAGWRSRGPPAAAIWPTTRQNDYVQERLELHRRRVPAWTTTATSATRRAPTT